MQWLFQIALWINKKHATSTNDIKLVLLLFTLLNGYSNAIKRFVFFFKLQALNEQSNTLTQWDKFWIYLKKKKEKKKKSGLAISMKMSNFKNKRLTGA